MTSILFALSLAFGASTGRFAPITNCGELLLNATRGLEAIERLARLDAERGVARVVWSRPGVHGDELNDIEDAARAAGLKFRIESIYAYLGTAVAVFQVTGSGRQASLFFKDLILMRGRELDLAQWLADVHEAKDDLWTEAEFVKKLDGKAWADFPYSYESDEHSGVRDLSVIRIWPSTFFSPRVVYMRLEREMEFPLLKAKTFVDAYQEWQGKPALFEIEGNVFVFAENDFLWDLRELRKADLSRRQIDLKVDPRPYLD